MSFSAVQAWWGVQRWCLSCSGSCSSAPQVWDKPLLSHWALRQLQLPGLLGMLLKDLLLWFLKLQVMQWVELAAVYSRWQISLKCAFWDPSSVVRVHYRVRVGSIRRQGVRSSDRSSVLRRLLKIQTSHTCHRHVTAAEHITKRAPLFRSTKSVVGFTTQGELHRFSTFTRWELCTDAALI